MSAKDWRRYYIVLFDVPRTEPLVWRDYREARLFMRLAQRMNLEGHKPIGIAAIRGRRDHDWQVQQWLNEVAG